MRATSDYNLGKLYADLVKEWHPTKNGKLTPYDVTPSSDRKVWWICGKGHCWAAVVGSRTRGAGCPACMHACFNENQGNLIRKAAPRLRGSLADKHPELAKQWHSTKNGNLTSDDVTPRSSMRIWWKCNARSIIHFKNTREPWILSFSLTAV